MSYINSFPFTDEAVKKYLCDSKLVLSEVEMRTDNRVYEEGFIYLRKDGSVDGVFEGRWFVENQYLAFYNKKDEYCFRIDSLAIRKELHYSGEDTCRLSQGMQVKKLINFYHPLFAEEKKIKFIISSTFTYYKFTLKRLIKSLVRNGIKKEDILVVVSRSPEEKEEEYLGVKTSFVKYNAYEYNGLVYSVENDLGELDYLFLLHDTIAADDNFLEIVNGIDIGLKFDIVYFSDIGTGNMGLYEYEFLKAHEDFIVSLKNIDRKTGTIRKDSNFDKKFFRNVPYAGVLNGKNNNKLEIILEKKDVYGTGNIREVIHLMDCGLFKFRAIKSDKKKRP